MDYAFIAAFVLLIVITATVSDVFFTQRNLSNLLRQTVTNGLLSLGMLVVILTGGIDLSVGLRGGAGGDHGLGHVERQGCRCSRPSWSAWSSA